MAAMRGTPPQLCAGCIAQGGMGCMPDPGGISCMGMAHCAGASGCITEPGGGSGSCRSAQGGGGAWPGNDIDAGIEKPISVPGAVIGAGAGANIGAMDMLGRMPTDTATEAADSGGGCAGLPGPLFQGAPAKRCPSIAEAAGGGAPPPFAMAPMSGEKAEHGPGGRCSVAAPGAGGGSASCANGGGEKKGGAADMASAASAMAAALRSRAASSQTDSASTTCSGWPISSRKQAPDGSRFTWRRAPVWEVRLRAKLPPSLASNFSKTES
mmetsp:Transcript_43775/g.110819  ORF Transcript_43775/g.110819 Transcript_43775/m.110819 type:complete len:268 (+) Transcript_43775:89-892(+)